MEKRKQAQNWRLRQIRERHGWTQKEVADQIDLPDVRTLRRWETGEASPSLRYRARLCELFAIDAEELGLMPNVDPLLSAQGDRCHPASPQPPTEERYLSENETHPIPVIFNLASWSLKQQPLATWLVEELNSKYQVPQQVGQRWVENDHILPLLDGLDHVSPALRKACVDAINVYWRQHGLVPLVLRSRREAYMDLSTQTLRQRAISIQPLTQHSAQWSISWWAYRTREIKQHNQKALIIAPCLALIVGIITGIAGALCENILSTALKKGSQE